MADERPELVRRAFAAYLAGDQDEWISLLHPEVDLHVDPATITSGDYHGPEEIERWGRQWDEAWDNLTYEPEDFIDAGETLVVGIRQRGRGVGSGVPVDQVVWWVLDFKDDQVRRIHFFTEKEPALEAAGIAGPG